MLELASPWWLLALPLVAVLPWRVRGSRVRLAALSEMRDMEDCPRQACGSSVAVDEDEPPPVPLAEDIAHAAALGLAAALLLDPASDGCAATDPVHHMRGDDDSCCGTGAGAAKAVPQLA